MKYDNGIIKKVGIYYPYFFNIVLKIEKRAFGWHYDGWSRERQYVDSTIHDNGRITHNFRVLRYCYFSRPACYQRGFFMMIFELLSKIVSWFRRLAWSFSPVVFIVALIFGLFGAWQVMGVVAIIYGVLVGASLLLAVLGYICRLVWKSDFKTDMMEEEAGYQKWSETPEGTYFDPDM